MIISTISNEDIRPQKNGRHFTFFASTTHRFETTNSSEYIERLYFGSFSRLKRYIYLHDAECAEKICAILKNCSKKETGQRGYTKVYYALAPMHSSIYYITRMSIRAIKHEQGLELYYLFAPKQLVDFKDISLTRPSLSDDNQSSLLLTILGLHYD